jgi:hypothetical protein
MMSMRNSLPNSPATLPFAGDDERTAITLIVKKAGTFRVQEIDNHLVRHYERTRPEGEVIRLSRTSLWIEPMSSVVG